MNMLTGFSAHLCDVVQKPRIVHNFIKWAIALSDAFKSYFCDFVHLG